MDIQREIHDRLRFKLTELEVTGETTYWSEQEFNQLKTMMEEETKNGNQYSVRKCADKPRYCEAFLLNKKGDVKQFAIYSTSPALKRFPADYTTERGETFPFIYDTQEKAQAACDKMNENRIIPYPYEVRPYL